MARSPIALLAALALSLALSVARSLAAQLPFDQGTRVRVFAADSLLGNPAGSRRGWRAGTVALVSSGMLVLDTPPPAGRVIVSLGDIWRIDVSRGRPTHRWLGATIGGAITGSAFVALACAFSDGSCRIGNQLPGFLAYLAVGATPGAIAGGMIGGRWYGAERWTPVWPPTRERMAMGMGR